MLYIGAEHDEAGPNTKDDATKQHPSCFSVLFTGLGSGFYVNLELVFEWVIFWVHVVLDKFKLEKFNLFQVYLHRYRISTELRLRYDNHVVDILVCGLGSGRELGHFVEQF